MQSAHSSFPNSCLGTQGFRNSVSGCSERAKQSFEDARSQAGIWERGIQDTPPPILAAPGRVGAGGQAPEPAGESRSVPPAEWPGLGYLPDDVQAVAGVRVAAALESAAGRALLGPLGLTPDAVNRSRPLSLAANEVDHLLFGASVR